MCKFQLPIHFDENERARLTTPPDFSIRNSSIPNAGLGAWTAARVPSFTVLGEYEGEEHQINGNQPYSWVVPCLYVMIMLNIIIIYCSYVRPYSSLGDSKLVCRIFLVIMLSGRKIGSLSETRPGFRIWTYASSNSQSKGS